jgi:hypothetical protein
MIRPASASHPPLQFLRHLDIARRLSGVLLLGLLLAQATALSHGISHSPVRLQEHHSSAVEPSDHWGHENGTPECRLVDQLMGGQAPGPDPVAVPRQPPAALPVLLGMLSVNPSPALRAYEARGPPRG